MTPDLRFADNSARLSEFIRSSASQNSPDVTGSIPDEDEARFNELALELFALQYESNPPYQRFCANNDVTPGSIRSWQDIPSIPVSAFKEMEITSLPPKERSKVFLSSGTTEQRPSRHFHSGQSLQVYETSLLAWFRTHWIGESASATKDPLLRLPLIILTPPPALAPHSSLVHMFECIRGAFGSAESAFMGTVDKHLAWVLDERRIHEALEEAVVLDRPIGMLGTAFNLVHLLDYLTELGIEHRLPAGSRVIETGGYKGRSRSLSKRELYSSVTQSLGIPPSHIISEYGMSELSSQAYDRRAGGQNRERCFHFPPWARVQIVSPETGREVGEGEAGLIRVHDLANVRSALAIQTEDLGVRSGAGFAFLGRVADSEPRGCSLMAV